MRARWREETNAFRFATGILLIAIFALLVQALLFFLRRQPDPRQPCVDGLHGSPEFLGDNLVGNAARVHLLCSHGVFFGPGVGCHFTASTSTDAPVGAVPAWPATKRSK